MSVGYSKQVNSSKQTAKSWYQIGKLLTADWRIGNEWKWMQTWLSTCDLNDWKDLGQADCNILFAAWWPPKGGRLIYKYIYSLCTTQGNSRGRGQLSQIFPRVSPLVSKVSRPALLRIISQHRTQPQPITTQHHKLNTHKQDKTNTHQQTRKHKHKNKHKLHYLSQIEHTW